MSDNSVVQERINELKTKINCAEETRDFYKDTNIFLYETNSLYVDTLKQELCDLANSERI